MKTAFYDSETSSWKKLLSIEIKNGIFSKIDSETIYDFSDVNEYLLPGFVDAHIHILEDPYKQICYDKIYKENFDILWERSVRNMRDAILSGVTSVKDLGGRDFISIDIRNEFFKHDLLVPNYYTSGCYFSRKGGHCDERGAVLVDNISDFRNHIIFLRKNNIDFVKIMNDKEVFSDSELKTMISIAHEYDMLVSVHAFHNKTALSAAKANTDIIEHVADFSDELLDIIENMGIIVVPTFVSAYDSCYYSCDGLGSDISYDILKEWYDDECQVIPKLFDRNIKIALGSDGGFLGTPCNSVIREIQLLHEKFDINMCHLMKSANIITPQTIRKEGQVGLIKQGYIADFLIYDKNPLDNIDNLGNPNCIMFKGQKINN